MYYQAGFIDLWRRLAWLMASLAISADPTPYQIGSST